MNVDNRTVSEQILTQIEDLRKSISEISVYDFKVYSSMELYYTIANKLNDVIKELLRYEVNISEEVLNQNECLQYLLGEGLKQEVIDKINEMVADGTMDTIVNQNVFADLNFIIDMKVFTFDTVEKMKAFPRLAKDYTIETLGYYTKNDGGGAKYYTVEDSTTICDNAFTIRLNDNLIAKLKVENNTVNMYQLGGKTYNPNDLFDNSSIFEKYCEFNQTSEKRVKLYIPGGIWATKKVTLTGKHGFDIESDYCYNNGISQGTILIPYENDQQSILCLGSTTEALTNFKISLSFSTGIPQYNTDAGKYQIYSSNMNKVTSAIVKMINCEYGEVDFNFSVCKGKALDISSVWEINFKKLNFRAITNHDNTVFDISPVDTTLNTYANITNCQFDYIGFESIHGDCIRFQKGCKFYNSHIGIINVEDGKFNPNGETYTNFSPTNTDFDEDADTHYYVLNFLRGANIKAVTIDSIELNNVAFRFSTLDNIKRALDSVIKMGYYSDIILTINNINIIGHNKNIRLIHQLESDIQWFHSNIIINNVMSSEENYKWYLDVKGLNRIEVCNFTTNKNNDLELFGSEFTPFYKVGKIFNDCGRGLNYYDENTINKLNLAYKPITAKNGSSNRNRTILMQHGYGSKLLIRAKIPNGETLKLVVDGASASEHQAFDLVGIGDYKWYELDLSSINLPGMVNLKTHANQTPIDYYLDCFRFI